MKLTRKQWMMLVVLVLGAFVTGVLISVGPAIIYPIMQSRHCRPS